MRGVCFGTFSLVHPGHVGFLRAAKALCEHLTVVVARDETVKRIKGKVITTEQDRLEVVDALKPVDRAVLGNAGDKYAILGELKPDLIILGPDQEEGEDKLAFELGKRGIKAKVVRIPHLSEGELHKSSKIVERIKKC